MRTQLPLTTAACIAAVAVLSTATSIALGANASSKVTNVRALHAFTHTIRARKDTTLPTSVAENITNMEAHFGGTASDIQEPIAGSPSVYLLHLGPNNLCMIINLNGASGTCNVALRQAGGSLAVSDTIVDGKHFLVGLAANDVNSINVTQASSTTTTGTNSPVQAQIIDNVFVASLPYSKGGTGTITLDATHADGTNASLTIPGIPDPCSGANALHC